MGAGASDKAAKRPFLRVLKIVNCTLETIFDGDGGDGTFTMLIPGYGNHNSRAATPVPFMASVIFKALSCRLMTF